jgi:predicted dinucleotide-binding enzyme
MADVTIFGAGNMGTAIDKVLNTGGATVDHIRSDDPPGPISGDIVILAVPHTARAGHPRPVRRPVGR